MSQVHFHTFFIVLAICASEFCFIVLQNKMSHLTSFLCLSCMLTLTHNPPPPFLKALCPADIHIYCSINVTRKLLILGTNTFYASYNILTTSTLFTSVKHFQIWSPEDNAFAIISFFFFFTLIHIASSLKGQIKASHLHHCHGHMPGKEQ